MKTSPAHPFTIASNQGEFGGGEVMLIAIAEAARALGYDVTIVAPATPGDVIATARHRNFRTVALPSKSRVQYLANLTRWDLLHRKGLLWCNGLRPALATAGHRNRIVHLHQKPHGLTGKTVPLARWGARLTIVPSKYLATFVPRSMVFPNWTETDQPVVQEKNYVPVPTPTIGYMGRLSEAKGLKVLCDAVNEISAEGRSVNLLLAGEARFVSEDEREALELAISQLNVTHVERAGWIERDEFFSRVDLAVFPSVAEESFGLVAAEAMAAKCPFVISDSGALTEVAGFDYPYVSRAGDSHDLARVLRLALSSDWTDQVGVSYKRWCENFTPTSGRSRLAGLLNSFKGI